MNAASLIFILGYNWVREEMKKNDSRQSTQSFQGQKKINKYDKKY